MFHDRVLPGPAAEIIFACRSAVPRARLDTRVCNAEIARRNSLSSLLAAANDECMRRALHAISAL